jgi:hypothetical protein
MKLLARCSLLQRGGRRGGAGFWACLALSTLLVVCIGAGLAHTMRRNHPFYPKAR